MTKPFSPAELTARVDALFRRTGGEEEASSPDEISQPPFLLNTRNRTLEKNGQRVKLTQVEYGIVKLFMENPGKALSREEILDAVWGKDYFGELKIVDVNIRACASKLRTTPPSPPTSIPCGGMAISGAAEGSCPGFTDKTKRGEEVPRWQRRSRSWISGKSGEFAAGG